MMDVCLIAPMCTSVTRRIVVYCFMYSMWSWARYSNMQLVYVLYIRPYIHTRSMAMMGRFETRPERRL